MTTTGDFRYLDPATISPSTKPWSKVDGAFTSYTLTSRRRSVTNIRDCLGLHSQRGSFGTDIDVAGFAVYHAPAQSTDFSSDSAVRTSYYPEVESLLRAKLPGNIARIAIFDHTIRKHDPTSPRQPVQQVHVDQTPAAAEARVRRHVKLPPAELDALLARRYQLINVWRPIAHAASDFPLAVVDWRTTTPADLVPVDLLYPLHHRTNGDDDDRGKETLPDMSKAASTEGYEVKGETYGVLPGEGHKFYYCKDMTPEGAKGRESIEVRCLVFYEE